MLTEEVRRGVAAVPCPKCGGKLKAEERGGSLFAHCEGCFMRHPIQFTPILQARKAGVGGKPADMVIQRKDGTKEADPETIQRKPSVLGLSDEELTKIVKAFRLGENDESEVEEA